MLENFLIALGSILFFHFLFKFIGWRINKHFDKGILIIPKK